VREADRDDNVRAVILSGKGKNFSVSDDISGMQAEGHDLVSNDVYQYFANQKWADWVAQGEPLGACQELSSSCWSPARSTLGRSRACVS
jgi:hypothetical protein